jgi:cytoplasmic tRNA 2-thiolation protein 2
MFGLSPAQRGIQDWKARISIRSLKAADPDHTTTTNHPSCTSLSSHLSLTPYLCYACHTTLTSRSSRGITTSSKLSEDVTSRTTTSLPVWVQANLQGANGESEGALGAENALEHDDSEVWKEKSLTRKEMKAEVTEFLLDD